MMADEHKAQPKRRKCPPSRKARNLQRSQERIAHFKEIEKSTTATSSQVEEALTPEPKITKKRHKWINWITKYMRRMRTAPTAEKIDDQETPEKQKTAREVTRGDPTQLYSNLEDIYRLSRIEESKMTDMVLCM